MNPKQTRDLLVRPTLKYLDKENGIPYSLAAELLIMGTIAVESEFQYLAQMGGGPAQGFLQMEPATESDIWNNYLNRKDTAKIGDLVDELAPVIAGENLGIPALISSPTYAIAIGRVHYWRRPEPLPRIINSPCSAMEIQTLGQYWKDHWNTDAGAGTVNKFMVNFTALINHLS